MMYDPAEIPMPPNVPGSGGRGSQRYSEQELRKIRAFYYGKISLIDYWIGEILRTLQERGTLDNTPDRSRKGAAK
jgi:arylsulfatase A-like enzyme